MKSISVTQFRIHLKIHLNAVTSSQKVLIVSRKGAKDDVVIMPMKECSSLPETAHLLFTPANSKRLTQSLEQIAGGKTTAYKI